MANSENSTPLMLQYQKVKSQYPEIILFFRLGDFYEMFYDDAIEVSKLLNLTLTHRVDAPMCGIPAKAVKVYIARLLKYGKKIAICEQVTVPTGKGLTERKVVEVITPGTTVEEDYLDRGKNNYIASLCFVTGKKRTCAAFACLDVSTARFFAQSWDVCELEDKLQCELERICPTELILPQTLKENELVQKIIKNQPQTMTTYYPDWYFSSEKSFKKLLEHFNVVNLRSFSVNENSPEIIPAGFLLDYAEQNSFCNLSQITDFSIVSDSEFVSIDSSSLKNLELVRNLHDGTSRYTLIEVINKTVTPMGNRLLYNVLLSPLKDVEAIKKRQEKVTFFYDKQTLITPLRNLLSSIFDIERLASRIAMDKAHGKDLLCLSGSLKAYIEICGKIQSYDLVSSDTAKSSEIVNLIESAINEDPSTVLTEGRLIRRGWSEELDHLHDVQENFTSILEKYTEEEKQKTGIQNLKVRYNRVIGYYMEVTKSKLSSVPSHFIKRQSLINADRYTTDELSRLEQELVSASEKIIELERRLFLEVRDRLKPFVNYLFAVAREIASLDVTLSMALCASEYRWVCPDIEDSESFLIQGGRHPIVEYHMQSGEFVPNGVSLDEKPFALITGPNMAGKSTFLRQNALITVLAQCGSYVPADSARIGAVDKIFCRVGASDNLARGESTFLVEMIETANIIRAATKRSLVIMDEVGRGTSTEDGLSIAWAVSEYLLNTIKCKTFFATHYHELTRLSHPALQLLCLEVLENEGDVVFLKKIKEGAAENSYGLHVAKLAGIPQSIVSRAEEIIQTLQNKVSPTEIETKTEPQAHTAVNAELFSNEELVIDDIMSTEPNEITPLQALQMIMKWKKQLN